MTEAAGDIKSEEPLVTFLPFYQPLQSLLYSLLFSQYRVRKLTFEFSFQSTPDYRSQNASRR